MNRLLLLDGNAILHRAYHALPPLTSPDGTIVNAVYGFTAMLMRFFKDLKPTHIAVAFDRPKPTFRKELYKQYQATRPKLDDALAVQIPLMHELLAAFGIPVVELDGFEADDVIGTIVSDCQQSTPRMNIDEVIIVTGDRDLLQLVVDEKILVFMPTKGLSEGRIYGEKEVLERMGVTPAQLPDFKALSGDSSDNYPGVTGIGPKTAVALLKEFGTLDGIYNALDSLPATTCRKLTSGREAALMFKDLATIRTTAPIDYALKPIPTLNTPQARAALVTFNFSSLVKRLEGNVTETAVVKGTKRQDIKVESKPQGEQQTLF